MSAPFLLMRVGCTFFFYPIGLASVLYFLWGEARWALLGAVCGAFLACGDILFFLWRETRIEENKKMPEK